MIDIVEVIRRSEQGVTQPYICKAADGLMYFVKGKGAGVASLVKEWLAGCLAEAFELPVPRFAILNVPRDLYEAGRNGMLADLGYGPVFGSQRIANANEITVGENAKVPIDTRQRIAVFDWWVMNGDRTLSEHGGNPNILWDTFAGRAFIIDHNLAFDQTISLAALEKSHVFGAQLSEIIDSPALQRHWSEEFSRRLKTWDTYSNELPERWLYLDDQLSIPSRFDAASAVKILRRFETSSMWTRK